MLRKNKLHVYSVPCRYKGKTIEHPDSKQEPAKPIGNVS
jgi:hypothetical protein